MANGIEFEIIATDKGTFKVVTIAAKGLNSELDKTAKAHARASQESDTHTNTMAKGAMAAGSAGRDFGKLAQSINGGSGSLVGAYATLAANIFAIGAAFSALKNAAQLSQLQEGIDRMGNRMGITLSSTAHQVRDLSGGMLNLEQSFRATAQAAAGGIKSDDIKRLAALAKDASYALGRDMPDSMDRLTKGVLKLEPELLDELGIMTRLDTSNRVYAASLGKTVTSLTAVEKQTGFMNAAASEGELKFKGLSDSASGAGFAKLAASFSDLTANTLKFINIVAEPLAALLSSTPGGLAGLTLIFASTISKQLVPGLKEVTVEAAKTAEATSKIAVSQALNIGVGQKQGSLLKLLSKQYSEGTADASTFKNKLDALSVSITQQTTALEAQDLSTKQRKTKSDELTKNKLNYEKLTVATIAMAEAEKAEAILAAQTAASKFNLVEASNQLNTATRAGAIIVEVESAGLKGLALSAKGAAFSFETLAMTAKTAGIAIMEALNIIGLIVAAFFMLYDAAKWAYDKMAGKELVDALKNLDEVQKHLSERTVEYNRIQTQAASASTRQALSAKLVTNNIKEQVDAINKLNAASKAPVQDTKGSDKALAFASPLTAAVGATSKLVIEYNRLHAAGDGAKNLLQEIAKSNIPEYNTAMILAAGSTEKFNKILKSGTPEQQISLLNSILDKLNDYDATISAVETSIKGLNKSYSEFTKSITPTTPYDNVIKSLTETNDVINNAQISMKNGIVDAKKLANVLSAIDPSTLSTMSAANANKDDIKSVRELVKTTENLNAATQIKNDIVAKGGIASKKITDDIVIAEKAQADAAEKGAPAYQRIARAQLDTFINMQKASIINSTELTVAQSRLSLLNQFNSLTGEGATAKVNAENRIKELQAQQLDMQIETAKLDIATNRDLLNESILLTNNKKQYQGIQDIVKETLHLKTADRIDEINQRIKTKTDISGKSLNKEQLEQLISFSQELQKQYDLTKKVELGEQTIKSIRASAAAIRSTEDTEAIKLAKSLQEKTAGDLQLAQSALKTKQSVVDLSSKQLTLEDTISGVVVTGAEAYDRISASQSKTRVERLAVLKAETKSQIATLNVQIEIGLRLKKNVQGYRDLVKALNDQLDTSEQILDVEDRTARLAALNLKTIEETNKTKLDNLNSELSMLDKIETANNSIFKDNAEILKIKKELAGVPTTATGNAKLAKEAAQQELQNAKDVRDIKVAIIQAEFILLRAQLEAAKLSAIKTNEALDKEEALLNKKSATYDKDYAALEKRRIDPNQIDKVIGMIDKAENLTIGAVDSAIALKGKQVTKAGAIETGVGSMVRTPPSQTNAPVTAEDTLKAIGEKSGTLNTAGAASTPDSGIPDIVVTAKTYDDKLNEFRFGVLKTREAMAPLIEQLKSLGPEGEFMSAATTGILDVGNSFGALLQDIPNVSKSFGTFTESLKNFKKPEGGFDLKAMFSSTSFEDFNTAAQGALNSASSVLGAISSIYNASSKQKIANVDREIAAEQKRDGKSAESVAKIKALESKKEAMAKKAFEMNKKIQIAQAVIATASAVMGALAAPIPGGAWNIPIAVMMGAMGAAQIAMIAGQSYSGGSSSVTTPSAPTALSIGKRSDSVDLAKSNTSAGGESGFVSGLQGTGSNASTFRRAAYGDNNTGRAGFIVGEKGPEFFTPSVPGSITPNDKMGQGQSINATINIQAIDSAGVEELLTNKRGHIIGMLREAANANGQKFLENVDTKKYSQGGRRL